MDPRTFEVAETDAQIYLYFKESGAPKLTVGETIEYSKTAFRNAETKEKCYQLYKSVNERDDISLALLLTSDPRHKTLLLRFMKRFDTKEFAELYITLMKGIIQLLTDIKENPKEYEEPAVSQLCLLIKFLYDKRESVGMGDDARNTVFTDFEFILRNESEVYDASLMHEIPDQWKYLFLNIIPLSHGVELIFRHMSILMKSKPYISNINIDEFDAQTFLKRKSAHYYKEERHHLMDDTVFSRKLDRVISVYRQGAIIGAIDEAIRGLRTQLDQQKWPPLLEKQRELFAEQFKEAAFPPFIQHEIVALMPRTVKTRNRVIKNTTQAYQDAIKSKSDFVSKMFESGRLEGDQALNLHAKIVVFNDLIDLFFTTPPAMVRADV